MLVFLLITQSECINTNLSSLIFNLKIYPLQAQKPVSKAFIIRKWDSIKQFSWKLSNHHRKISTSNVLILAIFTEQQKLVLRNPPEAFQLFRHFSHSSLLFCWSITMEEKTSKPLSTFMTKIYSKKSQNVISLRIES